MNKNIKFSLFGLGLLALTGCGQIDDFQEISDSLLKDCPGVVSLDVSLTSFGSVIGTASCSCDVKDLLCKSFVSE